VERTRIEGGSEEVEGMKGAGVEERTEGVEEIK